MLGRERWMAAVTPAVAGQFVMVSTAVGCALPIFVGNEFSVVYVAENSNSALPLFYRVTALWGAHEGSLLLWILLLGGWTVAVSIGAARLPPRFAARVLGVLGVVSFGFLLFTHATSNPFLRLDPAAPDGRDLNPILQDPALAVHPPILYTGYVGFAVAFAFACAAMLEGKLDQAWARWTRPWTTTAWGFLTCGIALGSFWAYYELGWGGFWFWDPVENASFMPWLVGTALIHSLAVTDKRGLFKSWTLLLAILAFSLSMLGTFLVRSGVLLSVGVHANWKRGRLQDKQRTLLYTLIAGAVLACGVVFGIYSHGRVLTPVGATLAFWIVLASLVDPIDRWRRGLTLPRAVIGMTVAHLGLALAVLALTTVQSFTIEKDVALAPGGSVSAGGYEFRFDGVRPVQIGRAHV